MRGQDICKKYIAILPCLLFLISACTPVYLKSLEALETERYGFLRTPSEAERGVGRNADDTLLAGVSIGGMMGYIANNRMDGLDRKKLARTYEENPDDQARIWTNSDNGDRYEVTPIRSYREDGRYCRNAVIEAVINGSTEKVHQTACRNRRGNWVVQAD